MLKCHCKAVIPDDKKGLPMKTRIWEYSLSLVYWSIEFVTVQKKLDF